MAAETIPAETPATPLDATVITLVVGGRERHVRNNRGQLLHWSVEGVRNFWRWFGDSKAVDSDGRPMVLYHGTGADFSGFDINAGGDLAQFFTPSTEVAEWFAEHGDKGWCNEYLPNVIPVILSLCNPKIISASHLETLIGDPDDPTGIDWTSISSVVAGAQREGFDGICITGAREYNGTTDDQWLAFDPRQIKSAIGNSGLFDPRSGHLSDSTDRHELAASTQRSLEESNSPDAIIRAERNESMAFVDLVAEADVEYPALM